MASVYKNEFKSTEILCPECGEICKIKFNDFTISQQIVKMAIEKIILNLKNLKKYKN